MQNPDLNDVAKATWDIRVIIYARRTEPETRDKKKNKGGTKEIKISIFTDRDGITNNCRTVTNNLGDKNDFIFFAPRMWCLPGSLGVFVQKDISKEGALNLVKDTNFVHVFLVAAHYFYAEYLISKAKIQLEKNICHLPAIANISDQASAASAFHNLSDSLKIRVKNIKGFSAPPNLGPGVDILPEEALYDYMPNILQDIPALRHLIRDLRARREPAPPYSPPILASAPPAEVEPVLPHPQDCSCDQPDDSDETFITGADASGKPNVEAASAEFRTIFGATPWEARPESNTALSRLPLVQKDKDLLEFYTKYSPNSGHGVTITRIPEDFIVRACEILPIPAANPRHANHLFWETPGDFSSSVPVVIPIQHIYDRWDDISIPVRAALQLSIGFQLNDDGDFTPTKFEVNNFQLIHH